MAGLVARLLMSNTVQTAPATTVRAKARIPDHTTAGTRLERKRMVFIPPW